MTESLPAVTRSWWRPGARFLLRTGRRTLAESLYLFTAPATAFVGLMLALSGLGLAAAGILLPGRSRFIAAVLAPTRWCASLERWRIGVVRSAAGGGPGASLRPWPGEASPAEPGLWLDAAHAVVLFPVTLVTAVLAGLWWFCAIGGSTNTLRSSRLATGPLPPMTLSVGSAQTHIALSLGLASPAGRLVFGTVVGVLLLITLPLMTRACVAAQAALGRELLSDSSVLHRRIRGLEQERDTARAQAAAAVTAEAAALRRLERDIHDGPQQHLVRLAMDLGRAQRHFDIRPEAAREALAEALTQTQEVLDELRALSRGIAPPILADRGLREAVTALAARCTVPAELDAGPLPGSLDPAAETAAYFVIAEALTNVAKHSRARQCTIGLGHDAGVLRAWVTDNGAGGAALDKGHGLPGLADRVQAAGGQLQISSPPGGPTTITAELPCP
jgi:signal transduction histidine kinase